MTFKTEQIGRQAFEHLKHGLATGEWDDFLKMATEDFSFWFPLGPFHGLNTGKDRAREFFQYVSDNFNEGLDVTLDNVMSNDTTVVFECRSEGKFRGEDYKNRVLIIFEIREGQISSYREYFGSDGKSY
jgi:ketosteroid isomerase-like protein